MSVSAQKTAWPAPLIRAEGYRVFTEWYKHTVKLGGDREDPVFTKSFCLEILVRAGHVRYNHMEDVHVIILSQKGLTNHC